MAETSPPKKYPNFAESQQGLANLVAIMFEVNGIRVFIEIMFQFT